MTSGCNGKACINFEFSAEWSAYCGILPCFDVPTVQQEYNILNLLMTLGQEYIKFNGGVLCGIIDGFVGDLTFLSTAGDILVQGGKFVKNAIESSPLSVPWISILLYNVVKERSIQRGVMKSFKRDYDFWIGVIESCKSFVSQIPVILNGLWDQVVSFFEAVTFQKGAKEAGYAIGQIVYENILSSYLKVGRLIEKYSPSVVRELKDAVSNKAPGLGNYMRKMGKNTNEYVDCGIRALGCFAAGTLILASNGLIPIEDIYLGDYVETNKIVNNKEVDWDEATGKYVFTNVEKIDEFTSNDQRNVDQHGFNKEDLLVLQLEAVINSKQRDKISIIRPQAWLVEHGINKEGDYIHLQVPEMHINGPVFVRSISPYNSKKIYNGGLGSSDFALAPVTGIFEHISSDVWQIIFGDEDTIRVTGSHLFFSLQQGGWLSAASLLPGEKILSRHGEAEVLYREKIIDTLTVYNLEVGYWHNFLVGKNGAIVHNNYLDDVIRPWLKGLGVKLQVPDIKTFDNIPAGYYFSSIVRNIPGNIKVFFTARCFPDFRLWCKGKAYCYHVLVGRYAGNYTTDYLDAFNDVAAKNPGKLRRVPGSIKYSPFQIYDDVEANWKTYSWHHHEDGKTLMPVLEHIHSNISHTGGKSLVEKWRVSSNTELNDFIESMEPPYDFSN